MNYSEMLDFEINVQVAEVTGKHADYCNSWADAGPIIEANKITISAPMEYDQPADWLSYPASDSDTCISWPKPLRAAMTCFLVMQEKRNA